MKTRYENLRTFLDAKGWTETRGAEYFGCSIPTISRVSRYQRKPNGSLVARMIAAGIDVTPHLETPNVSS
jgi:transcriptional regulator with XRE-family HTH domain